MTFLKFQQDSPSGRRASGPFSWRLAPFHHEHRPMSHTSHGPHDKEGAGLKRRAWTQRLGVQIAAPRPVKSASYVQFLGQRETVVDGFCSCYGVPRGSMAECRMIRGPIQCSFVFIIRAEVRLTGSWKRDRPKKAVGLRHTDEASGSAVADLTRPLSACRLPKTRSIKCGVPVWS